MKNLEEKKELYAKFMRNCGKEDRLNKFSFELLTDKAFRSQMRNSEIWRKKFAELQWTDDCLLDNIDELGESRTICFERFGNRAFILFIPEFSKFRVSVNYEKRSKYIAYSREGHPNVREKASVLYLKSLKNTGLSIPERVSNRLAELFSAKWKAYVESNDYKLHIDHEFERIYSGEQCEGNFHSCMEDRGLWRMYADHTRKECHAAYLTNNDDKVVARAILWDNAQDCDGNTYRYLDRQYSTDCKPELQQILVDMCIAQGKIDLYKPVGCSCSNADNIVNLKGERFKEELSVYLDVDYGDPVCYLDTFKYYNMDDHAAYDYKDDYTHILENTDGELEDNHEGEVYSSVHDCWIDEYEAVYCEDADDYYYEDDEEICYPVDRSGAYLVENCVRTSDTEEWYYFTDNLYYTEDTYEYYAHCDELYYCESDGCWYENTRYLRYSKMHECYIYEDDAIWIEDLEDYDFERNKDEYCVRTDGNYYTKVVTKDDRKWLRAAHTPHVETIDYNGITLFTRTQAIKLKFADNLNADEMIKRYKAAQILLAKDYSEILQSKSIEELIK
ncbi:MAG: hypothetical protein IJ759_07905 [Bacteroidales bacterium]|nr:hypothetical protein [Bacteroidales bacterium]MBR1775428.1 hypothetical protein [Bacteroidales bacterium]